MKIYQWLHSAAKRLKVITSNAVVFTADVLYHQSGYNRFVYSCRSSHRRCSVRKFVRNFLEISENSQENTCAKSLLLKNFAKFLKNLFCRTPLGDCFRSYKEKSTTKTEMNNEEISVLSAKKEFEILIKKKDFDKKVKSFFLTNFENKLQFTLLTHGIHGNPIIVHSVQVNPVDYAMASIIRAGIRDKEITLAFAKMINHKLRSQELSKSFPLSAKNLMKELDKYDPIKELFNVVSLSCNPTVPINDFSYASPKSPNKAKKIC